MSIIKNNNEKYQELIEKYIGTNAFIFRDICKWKKYLLLFTSNILNTQDELIN